MGARRLGPALVLLLAPWHCGGASGSGEASNGGAKKCACANATLCLPLAHGPPPRRDVHVTSDCGGPWNGTRKGPASCDWRDLDFGTITTLVYQKLLSNATAHARLARELVTAITDAGMDGVEFDFEGIDHALVANCSAGFDYGAAHVAMIRTVTEAFHAALPQSTVT